MVWEQVAFTGSGPVGRLVAQAASKNIKPVTLELGGKSPAIVWKDVDIEEVCDDSYSPAFFASFFAASCMYSDLELSDRGGRGGQARDVYKADSREAYSAAQRGIP